MRSAPRSSPRPRGTRRAPRSCSRRPASGSGRFRTWPGGSRRACHSRRLDRHAHVAGAAARRRRAPRRAAGTTQPTETAAAPTEGDGEGRPAGPKKRRRRRKKPSEQGSGSDCAAGRRRSRRARRADRRRSLRSPALDRPRRPGPGSDPETWPEEPPPVPDPRQGRGSHGQTADGRRNERPSD